MAITINGTGSITGLTAGGLPDGSVTAADLASSLDLTGKTVTLPSGTGGKVLQVVQGFTDTSVTVSTATFTDTGLSRTIQPQAAGSSILVIVNQQLRTYRAGHAYGGINIVRGTTNVAESVFDGNGPLDFGIDAGTGGHHYRVRHTFTYLDTPTYTLGDTLTYKTQGRPHVANQGAVVIFQEPGAANNGESYIILMEVAA